MAEAPLKLHWSPRSPYVRKVMVCAHELGLAGQLELVRSVAAMRKPNDVLMQDNPLSKIPTLVLPGGTALFDSVVICEYLDSLGRGTLFPRDGEARWQSLRWHALADGLLDTLILLRNERERTDAACELLDAFERKTLACLQVLESEVQRIEQAPLSIGTITIGCALGYLDYRFDALAWRGRAPRLAQWFAVLDATPSFQATQVAEG